ncbi:Alpha/beta hydrolase fold-3 domain protein OS=Tsukamurella paurometabola (strain ATCC 8368 / DSM/ CCUG 35730 / CIP 100753 / JCM 10117 / KCTC 9821 / NBRC 16120 / NCIMB 702349 / NCTC 13040) OX=521096 GN=Tpau_3516 PE=4 SV=1 [Tsukamurella paurometabola]|uniref:Alpha/beta hydrolase fold-3 domain protein n=1 Tax=Tsukamurella paurometabola (strain ATCC 8368 / DSM 20162 / CCUG 35730 / CIP 100753 / JCM 10117 / KCTC 9821 / NBRC 16120 / NCIMB 702349 / NCTC 13040) TaxID=521096 RepID=D5UX76_TSUPD|nr:alpha/beta hydrolase [Tsukamurella paurometabola]ADG80095.1 Alpha/beta hydrolase fold-3 domain protein [Tsukamurella paurometabola DSM 20162]SUP38399.1 Monoterpene epsilon-lactone hydrolase [Tsukamurella paurometabola]
MDKEVAAPPVPSRATRRSALTAVATRYGLGVVSGLIPMNQSGVWVARGLVAAIMGALGSSPRGTRATAVRTPTVPGDWVLGPGVRFGRRAVYYIHGSAYAICSARTHRSLAARLSAVTGLPVFVVDYRLAPEHPFPAAADDIAAGFDWLLTQGYAAGDIVLAGDSAGGHLAVDLVVQRAREEASQPAAVALFSPLIDLTFGLAAEQERTRRDPAITAAAARRLVDLYTAGIPDDHPRLRLDLAFADRLPPFLIQAGGAEMLSADARYLDRELRENGGTSTLEIWPGLMHVFQALPRLTPEADNALLRVRDFLAATDPVAAETDSKAVS